MIEINRLKRLDSKLMNIGTLVELGRAGFEEKYHGNYALANKVQEALISYFNRHDVEAVPGWGLVSLEDENENVSFVETENSTPAVPSDSYSPLHIPESRSIVFADDPIGVLGMAQEHIDLFAERSVYTVFELVRALGEGQEKLELPLECFAAVKADLLRRAYAPSASVDKAQFEVLRGISGSSLLSFDPFGVLCNISSICKDDISEVKEASLTNLASTPVASLELDELLVRRLERKGVTCVGDFLSLSQEEFIDKYGWKPSAVRAIYGALEKLKEAIANNDKNSTYDQYVAGYSFAARMVSRDVCSALEGNEFPVFEKALSVFALPYAASALKRGPGHVYAVRYATNKICTSFLAGVVARATLLRRLRSNIQTLERNQAAVVVTLPRDVYWTAAAKALVAEFGSGRICSTQAKTFDFEASVVSLAQWLDALPPDLRKLVNARVDGDSITTCASNFAKDERTVKYLLWCVYLMRPLVFEERYLPMFETYKMTVSDFTRITGLPERVYWYLADISVKPTIDKLETGSFAVDLAMDADPAQALESVNDVEAVELGPASAFEYVLKKYANDQPQLLSFLQSRYLKIAEENAFSYEDVIELKDLGRFYGRLLSADFIVSSHPDDYEQMTVRYFDSSSVDFSDLRELLEKSVGLNVVCSLDSLLIRDAEFKGECEELGLLNAVEVYFVIRNWCGSINGMKLLDNDNQLVQFGEASIEFQLRKLIREIGPISVAALKKEYMQLYGDSGETFFEKYLPLVDDLRNGNQYFLADSKRELTYEQREFLLNELSDESRCYQADLLKSRFEVNFPKSAVDVLSSNVLGKLNKVFSEGLIFDRSIDIDTYFSDLLDGKLQFSIRDVDFGETVFKHPRFRSLLEKRKRQFEFVEVKEGSYVSTKPFLKLDQPVTVGDLRNYLDCAIDFMEPEVPYTVYSLRKSGFTHKIDSLEAEVGFDTYFYESLLAMGYVNGRLKKTNVGNRTVFCRIDGSYNSSLLVKWLLNANPAIEIEELAGLLANQFDIEIDANRLRAIVKRTDCCYKKELDMVFSSEREYGKKVHEWL